MPLYLLDTNVEGNSPEAAAITNRLYGGDTEHRLRQEMVLGIGGVRVLRALGLQPQVFHTNEGHAGFLSLERIRELVASGFTFREAVESVRAGGVFTTHTPVPAGIDRFSPELMKKYFGTLAASYGVTFDDLMAIGSRDDEKDGKFNMAVMGLRLAGRANGVAQLHGEVSREMFAGLWPNVPQAEVPIGAITNSVHAPTWVGDHIAPLLAKSVGPVWDGADEASWSGVGKLDPAEVWAARAKGRAAQAAARPRPTGAVRLRRQGPPRRPAGQGHDPRHRAVRPPTRRGPPLHLPSRLRHGGRPRHVPRVRRVAQQPAPTARGMRHQRHEGRAQRCPQLQHPRWLVGRMLRRDQREATSLFGLLEREIMPLYYDRGNDGLPHGWIGKMAHNWKSLGPFITAARMVRDYTTDLYEPAAAGSRLAAADDGAPAKQLAAWKQRVRTAWPVVRVVEVHSDTTPANEGDLRHVQAHVQIDGLDVSDLAVQVLHGAVDSEGEFVGSPNIVNLGFVGDGVFEATYVVGEAGPYGLTVRAVPAHPHLVSPVELGLVAWAG